jgi:hypothetical protein
VAEARTLLLGLLSLSDEITATIERYGIATSAQEAAVIRNVVAFGRRLLTLLRAGAGAAHRNVGKPLDPRPATWRAGSTGRRRRWRRVLREVQIG